MGKTKPKKVNLLVPEYLPSLTSGYFILLALAGYLSSGEYSELLDLLDNNLHTDDQIDEILDAMDYHDRDRMGLVKVLSEFSKDLLQLVKEDEISLQMNLVRFEMQIIEMRDIIQRYSSAIREQQDLFLSCLDRVQSSFQLYPTALLPHMNLYFEFRVLLDQYRYQMDFEERFLSDLINLLDKSSVYFELEQGDVSKSSQVIQRWSHVSARSILDQDFWVQTKNKLFSFIQSLGDNNKNDKHGSIQCPETNESNSVLIGRTSISPKVDDRHFSKEASEMFNTAQTTLYDIIHRFLGFSIYDNDIMDMKLVRNRSLSEPHFVLLTGAYSSGKSFFCQDFKERLGKHVSNIHIIMPKLPVDFLGPIVGSIEDKILSLFTFLDQTNPSDKVIVLMDDIHHLFGEDVGVTDDGKVFLPVRDHLTLRIRAAWKTAIDRLTRKISNNCLLICTSPTVDDEMNDRFDYTFQLLEPGTEERKRLISQSLTKQLLNCAQIEILEEVVTATLGKSRGEICTYCRDAWIHSQNIMSDRTDSDFLLAFKSTIRSALPESIKKSAVEGFADLKVWSAKELQNSIALDEDGNEIFPLIGSNAKQVWEKVENIIIAPLCRSETLHSTLYGEFSSFHIDQTTKSVCSGVLIHGDPGVGKSTMARYCAFVASRINPNVRLLEVPCTSLIHKELGGSERSVKKLFETARAASPCILILDGIENIAKVRGNDNTTEGTMDRILSTLLIEMDGVSSKTSIGTDQQSNIAVIGITHNPISWIDPALLRPGRLEQCLHLEKPDVDARKSILASAIHGLKIDFTNSDFFDPKDESQLIDIVTMKSYGKSAADILALVEKAKMMAVRDILADNNKHEHLQDVSSLKISFRNFL